MRQNNFRGFMYIYGLFIKLYSYTVAKLQHTLNILHELAIYMCIENIATIYDMCQLIRE